MKEYKDLEIKDSDGNVGVRGSLSVRLIVTFWIVGEVDSIFRLSLA